MPYVDIGFDRFLNRIAPTSQNNGGIQELDPTQTDTFFQQISGNKVIGGILSSPDGRVKLDLDQGILKISDGVQDLVTFGLLPDGTVGLLIKDSQGNLLMQVSQGVCILQSSDKAMTIDLVAAQADVRDAAGNLRVRFGKDLGGF